MLRCYGTGFCANDPELKYIGQNNVAVVQVTICFNRSYKRGDEWQKETAFVRCKAWGRMAERMNEVLGKGKLVSVEGFITQENWTTQDNQKRSMLVLRVERFQPCEKFTTNGQGGDGSRTRQRPPAPTSGTCPPVPLSPPQDEPSPSDNDVPPADDDHGDIPF